MGEVSFYGANWQRNLQQAARGEAPTVAEDFLAFTQKSMGQKIMDAVLNEAHMTIDDFNRAPQKIKDEILSRIREKFMELLGREDKWQVRAIDNLGIGFKDFL